MLQRAQEIITQANADGTEPDAALHDLIQQTLTQASQTGQAMTSEINGHGGASVDGELPRKRQR